MAVTGNPLIVSGMVSSPPGPVYPVMVIAPLLVVKVNCWATAIVASMKRSNDSSLTAAVVRLGDGRFVALDLKKNPVLMVFPTATLHLY